MMAVILNSAMLDSDTLFSALRFTQKHSHSTLTLTKPFNLTQTYSFSLNLMMAAILNSVILNSAILDSATLVFPLKLTHTCKDWFPPFPQKKLHSHFPPRHLQKKPSLIHSDSTWWRQPSWILPCWIKKLYSFILTQLDDGSHLEFCYVVFRHLVFFSQIHSKTLSLHSDSD